MKKKTKQYSLWLIGCAILGGSCAAIWGIAGIIYAAGIVVLLGSILYSMEGDETCKN